jgi:hypothetical protein
LLDVEARRERLDIVDRHEFVEPQRKQGERHVGLKQHAKLRADGGLVRGEAGIDQDRGVGLFDEVTVRHRISARARRVGADAAIQFQHVLQRIEPAFRHHGEVSGGTIDLAAAGVGFATRDSGSRAAEQRLLRRGSNGNWTGHAGAPPLRGRAL